MSEFKVVSLILMLLVVLDASGDAFRKQSWQNLHHAFEVIGVAVWFFIWAKFEFYSIYIAMYISGRVFIFDPLFNIIAGNKISYIGTSSLYGKLMTWFANLKRVKEHGALVWVIRSLALITWIAWFITK